MELPDSVYDKVEHSIDVLVDNPGLLRDYDPPYDAAMPLSHRRSRVQVSYIPPRKTAQPTKRAGLFSMPSLFIAR